MFLVVFACLLVCLSAALRKSYGRIALKLLPEVCLSQRKNPLNSSTDPDQSLFQMLLVCFHGQGIQ